MVKLIALILAAVLTGCSGVDESKIPLTEAELKFIADHPTVTWAVEDNRPPYIFVEGGDIKGLSFEYLQLIAKKTGLKFSPIKTITFYNSVQAVKNGRVDVITSLRPTPDLTEFMAFTQPIAYSGGVFVFRVNTLPRSPLTTGIRKGGAVKPYLESRFPDMKLVELDDDEESMSLLQKGLLDGAVMDEMSANYLVSKGALRARKAIINFDFPYSFGYAKENHPLGTIMTKAISSISQKEKEKLNSKWLIEEK